MFRSTRRVLLALGVLLMFLSVGAHSAQAQAFSPAQVKQMLKIRLLQANALNSLIQQLAASPTAQIANSPVQSTIALYQSALAQVQYQINQLQLLATALNQAYAVDGLLQNAPNPAILANLQYALATIQAQISNLQATIVVP